MTKAELVDKICEKAGLASKAQADTALSAMIDALREALAEGDSVMLPGFGTFKTAQRAERKGRNPKTKEEITIPACTVAKFVPGKQLKEKVKGK